MLSYFGSFHIFHRVLKMCVSVVGHQGQQVLICLLNTVRITDLGLHFFLHEYVLNSFYPIIFQLSCVTRVKKICF